MYRKRLDFFLERVISPSVHVAGVKTGCGTKSHTHRQWHSISIPHQRQRHLTHSRVSVTALSYSLTHAPTTSDLIQALLSSDWWTQIDPLLTMTKSHDTHLRVNQSNDQPKTVMAHLMMTERESGKSTIFFLSAAAIGLPCVTTDDILRTKCEWTFRYKSFSTKILTTT